MATISNTGNCGVEEITTLATTQSNTTPRTVLLEICRAMEVFNGGKWAYSFATYAKNNSHLRLRVPAILLYSGTVGGSYDAYGPILKKAVEEFKLGTIVESKPAFNRLYHPNYKAIAWLWTPDAEALEAWYNKENPKPAPPQQIKYNSQPAMAQQQQILNNIILNQILGGVDGAK